MSIFSKKLPFGHSLNPSRREKQEIKSLYSNLTDVAHALLRVGLGLAARGSP
jgi:hypothetical protein